MDLDIGLNFLFMAQKNALLIYLNTGLYRSYMFRRHTILALRFKTH
jgi:hypothetical protein